MYILLSLKGKVLLSTIQLNSDVLNQCNVKWGGEERESLLQLIKLEFKNPWLGGGCGWWCEAIDGLNMEPNSKGPPMWCGCGGWGGGGGRTIGRRPWRWASFNRAAICFFHLVRRFWNQVLIWTSVRFKLFESSSLLDTDKYLSALSTYVN